jgi:hypothetical protein
MVHSATQAQVRGLEDGRTYFWTIVPVTKEGVYGVYGEEVRSFTVDLSGAVLKYGVEVHSEERMDLEPGESSTVTVNVTNTGLHADHFAYVLDTGELGSNASVVGKPQEALKPGQSVLVEIKVTVPADTRADEYVITFTAKSQKAEDEGLEVKDNINITVDVAYISIHPPLEEDEKEDKGGSGRDLMMWGLVIAVIVVVVGILFWMRKRRLDREKEGKEEVKGEVEPQTKVIWSVPTKDTTPIDVQAAQEGPDGAYARITTPTSPGAGAPMAVQGAPQAGTLAGGPDTSSLLLPKAQETGTKDL